MKKLIINENQYKNLIEMAYPSHFDIEYFKSLPSFNARIKYCKEKLPYIGGGSARMVFKIDDEKCLKLAKNKKGLVQNETETDWYLQDSGVVAKVFDYDEDNYTWVEMELLEPAYTSNFKNYLNASFNEFVEYITWFGTNILRQGGGYFKHEVSDEIKEKLEEDEFVMGIVDLMGSYDMAYGDLIRRSSYGVNKDGDILLVDYGATVSTLNDYYGR